MKKFLAIAFMLFATSAMAQNSRQIQSSDITTALGYTPLQSIGGMTGPAISCGAGLTCIGNSIASNFTAAGTLGQIQYNNGGVLGGLTVNGDATLDTSTGVLTLGSVNANVGSFGSATNCVAFTTNAKGLITAASAVTCTPAIGSVTGLGSGVATFLGTPSSANLRAALTDESGTGAAYFQGGDIGTPSAGVGTNLTALNASNISTGILATARGGVPQGAWTSFTPSPSCGTATFTSPTASWQQIAPKTTLVRYDILVNAIGTCASASGSVSLNLPNTSNAGASTATYDYAGAANVLCWIQGSAQTVINCRTATATGAPALASGSHFVISLVYENQ